MVGHFLGYLQHQSENEDDHKQDHCGFTVKTKSDYLNGAISQEMSTPGEQISSTNGP